MQRFICILLCALAHGSVLACDYCISSQGISPVEVGSSGARYDARYLYLGKMYDDGKEIVNSSDAQETYITHQVSMYYHIGDKFSASLYLPFVNRSESGKGEQPHGSLPNSIVSSQSPQHGTMTHSYHNQVNGLSDLAVFGRYRVFDDEQSSFFMTVIAGVKLPTGATNAINDEGELLNPHIQAGTGSTDPLLGLDMFYGGGDYSFSLNLMSCYPTMGAQNYQFGTMLNYSINGKYNLLNFGEMNSIIAAFGVSGELHAQESMNGEAVVNTGGNTTYLFPGVQLLVGSMLTFDLSYHIPIVHELKGTQLGESYKVMAGAQYLF
ncbi:MAG TPA: transporter [Candidatus Kapabacteria bacterium]